MKRMFFKIAAFTFVLSLITASAAQAGPVLDIYSKNSAGAKVGFKFSAVPDTGLPVTVTAKRENARSELVYTYMGSKKITVDVDTGRAALSAVSSTKALEARARENYVYIENIGLRTGESATVTLTFTHKEFGVIVQKFDVTVTDGSPEAPHLVSSAEDFSSIIELGLDKNYKQTASFSLSGITEWTPIGDAAKPFTGVYDGGGHKITGMEFTKINSGSPGLFGVVKGANARVIGVNAEGKIDSLRYQTDVHGTIVGIVDEAIVSDCSFEGEMAFRTGKLNAGGIVAEVTNGATVKRSRFNGKITSQNNRAYIGGIAGIVNNGYVEDCEAAGQIISESTEIGANIGGIAGLNKGVINSSVVKADLSAYGEYGYLGGIAGYNYADIKESAFKGNMYSKGDYSWAGGITGCNLGRITGCAVKGEISFLGGISYIGGIAGHNENGTIENSINEAGVTGKGARVRVGGIAGENSSYIGQHSEKEGKNTLASIVRCVSGGNIEVSGSGSSAGGIAGRNYGAITVAVGTNDSSKAIIEKCAVKAAEIAAADGAIAGRITALNEAVMADDKPGKSLQVALLENAAFIETLLNGMEAHDKTGTNEINGENLDSAELAEFISKNGIAPGAEQYIK